MEEIVLIGPGAIGGAVAGALIDGGHRLTIAARSPFDQIEVTHPFGKVASPVECVRKAADLPRADVVFLAVKAHQTLAAAEWLDACVGEGTTIVILQNGVEHVERIGPLVPSSANLVPVVIALPSRSEAPGRIEVAAKGVLTAPEAPGASRLAELVDSEFLSVRLTTDWPTAAWAKLLLNAACGGIGTLARRDNRMFKSDPDARDLVLSLMREIASVARAEGADLPDERCEKVLEALIERAGPHLSSIVVDRSSGRATEWDARNAVVERIAKGHGIDVPMNRMLTTLIRLGEPRGVVA